MKNKMRTAQKICIYIFLLFFLCGCGRLSRLMTLKAYSQAQDRKAEYVENQNKNFEKLLEVVKNDQLKDYPDKKSVYAAFGEPIFALEEEKRGRTKEKWLYRYSVKYFNSEKVYLYFDDDGKLIDWEHVKPPKKETEESS